MLPGGRTEKGSEISEKKLPPKNIQVCVGLLKVRLSLNWLALIAHGGTEIQLLCRTKVQSVKVKEFKYREERRKQCSSPGGMGGLRDP